MIDELIAKLRQLDIVYHNSVNLKNAGVADFYVDVKKSYGYPDALKLISQLLWEQINKEATCIATSGYGGISPASVISVQQDLNLTLIRDKQKGYGKSGWIDGYVPNENDKVAIVDDVFTTGGSLKQIIEVLEPTKAKVLGCYVIVKRGEGELNVPLSYLINAEDLI